jgi:2-deoxy-D-gluconate 3-dehydrogenase
MPRANPFDLTGKAAFITGGNGGIGLGIARGFVRQGAAVAVAARNKDKMKAALEALQAAGAQVSTGLTPLQARAVHGSTAKPRAIAVECDVTSEASVRKAVDEAVRQLGGIDVLVNNSGTSRRAPELHELSQDDFEYVVDVNLNSLHRVSVAVFPHMKARGGGKVINIGSMMAIFGSPYASAYSASKGGVVQYTKSCAIAWAKYNIQVNCIMPGWVHTDMTAAFLKMYPEREMEIARRTPAGRWATPDEMAGPAVFLASTASDFVTGAAIAVDGGFSIAP